MQIFLWLISHDVGDVLQILSVPGYPEENSQVRMMGLKRYSDFKAFRAALLDVLEAKRRIERRSSLNGGDQDIIKTDIVHKITKQQCGFLIINYCVNVQVPALVLKVVIFSLSRVVVEAVWSGSVRVSSSMHATPCAWNLMMEWALAQLDLRSQCRLYRPDK